MSRYCRIYSTAVLPRGITEKISIFSPVAHKEQWKLHNSFSMFREPMVLFLPKRFISIDSFSRSIVIVDTTESRTRLWSTLQDWVDQIYEEHWSSLLVSWDWYVFQYRKVPWSIRRMPVEHLFVSQHFMHCFMNSWKYYQFVSSPGNKLKYYSWLTWFEIFFQPIRRFWPFGSITALA